MDTLVALRAILVVTSLVLIGASPGIGQQNSLSLGLAQPPSYNGVGVRYSAPFKTGNCSFAQMIFSDESWIVITSNPNDPDCLALQNYYNLLHEAPLARSSPRLRLAVAGSAGTTTAIGSEGVTGATLANGNQLVAWLAGMNLNTGILSVSSTTPQMVAQYTVGPGAIMVIAADFNGDGNADLAVSNFGNLSDGSGASVRIFLGNGDGTFNTGATLQAGSSLGPLYAADVNGDGNLDLVVGLQGFSAIVGGLSLLLGNGDGTFQPAIAIPTLDIPSSLLVLDLNGDGKPDIAVLNRNLATVSILLGNGDGTFGPASSVAAGSPPATYMSAMDLNGDGNPDLVVTNPALDGIAFLFGNGDGTFQPPVEYATGADAEWFAILAGASGEEAEIAAIDAISNEIVLFPVLLSGIAESPQLYLTTQPPTGVAAGDLNGDGFPDMVAADGAISVLLRNPVAQFSPPVDYPLQSGSQAAAVAIGDLNGDGHNDVVALSASSSLSGTSGGTVDVAIGVGDGTLGQQYSYPVGGPPSSGTAPSGVVIADFNGDGKPDVAAGFQSGFGGPANGGVSVLLGNGDGTLQPAVNYAVGNFSTLSIVTADFNGDGILDIAAGVGAGNFNFSTPGALAILLGNGDGTFQTATLTQVGSPAETPIALASADVNGDGKPDLVASIWDENLNDSIVVLLNNGDGTFTQLAPVPVNVSGYAVAIADLNGDGIPDLVVADCCGLSESIYLLGNGDGTFQSPQNFSSGSSVFGFAVTDWNNDGVVGLAIAQYGGSVMGMVSGLNTKVDH